MSSTPNVWTFVLIAVNVAIGAFGFLLVRWIALQIRASILELENRLSDKFASKSELQGVRNEISAVEARVDAKVDLAGRIDGGFDRVINMLRVRGRMPADGAAGVVTR